MSRRRLATLTLAVVLFAAPAPWGPLAAAAVLTLRLGPALVRRLAARARPRRLPEAAVRLGRDGRGRVVALTDEQLGAHALIVGASGAGKSTTLETILADRIARGAPVVAIDMKGSPAFARALALAARDAGRTLRVWTPEGPSHWNPLAHGGPTALKDRLISAERFSEPHYQRAAERYLQSALQVLAALAPERPPRFSEVVAAMEPARLRGLAAQAPPPLAARVTDYLDGLTPDQLSAARGLGTRLALLSESDAGSWLEPPPPGGGAAFDLGGALGGGAVALVSINSSIYGALGAQLGALAVQDLTSAAGRRLGAAAADGGVASVAIDEFSALGADNVLALLARGREAGVGVVLATQELADLERAGRGFRDQVLGITAVTLAHRQEVHESALAISRMAGTRTVWRETRVLPAGFLAGGRAPASRGTRSQHEEPVVHPNAIKRLSTGQLVLLSGVPRPTVARVRVEPPRLTRSADRAQPAPGVTR
jgi:conjugal transfer pilus assembly protein TraD